MKACLIFTGHDATNLNETNKELAFRDEGIGYIPPLSLMMAGAIMEKEGVEVKLIDVNVERLSYEEVLRRVQEFEPDLLGFTLTTYHFHPVLSWINRLKADTGLTTIVGGKHVELYPVETMSHKAIDFAICGEGEFPIPEFIDSFLNNKPYAGIKSLCYRDENGELFVDRTRQGVDDLDSMPWPGQHLLKNDLYANILTKRKNFTAMLSSRGCPYRCTFCDQKRPTYRNRSAQSFVDEIKYNYENFGIREFDIYDSTFTADRKRIIEFSKIMAQEDMDVQFTVRSTVMAVTHEVLDALKSAGCHTIMYGIETSSPEILEKMKKRIPRDRLFDRIQYTHDIGIQVLGFFLFGYPGETHKTIQETIQLALDLPLTYAQFTVLSPYPDTEIYDYYMDSENFNDYWAQYTLDAANERVLDLVGTELTREECNKYLGIAYRKFYFRPRIIWHRLSQLRSLDEFRRIAKGAMGLIKNSMRQYVSYLSFSHPVTPPPSTNRTTSTH